MNKRKHNPITFEALKSALAESTSCLAAAKSLGLPGYYVSVTCSTLGLKATGAKKSNVVRIAKRSVPAHRMNKAIDHMRHGLSLDEAALLVRIPYLRLRSAMKAGGLPLNPKAVKEWDDATENQKVAA